jgi:dihydrodipicolinate reductase
MPLQEDVSKMILVIGAAGRTGRAIIQALVDLDSTFKCNLEGWNKR